MSAIIQENANYQTYKSYLALCSILVFLLVGTRGLCYRGPEVWKENATTTTEVRENGMVDIGCRGDAHTLHHEGMY